MLSQKEKDKLRELKPELEHYVKKVRGYLAIPTGIEAVIIWYEFKDWQVKQYENVRDIEKKLVKGAVDGSK